MALNMPSVFGKTDDDLKPRWQQSGSVVKNIFHAGVSDETIYTVTSGKTLFIASVQMIDGSASRADLRDGGVGGTDKVGLELTIIDTTHSFVFDPPLQFSTDIYASTNASPDLSLQGWEE
jgi:hypothetical protein